MNEINRAKHDLYTSDHSDFNAPSNGFGKR